MMILIQKTALISVNVDMKGLITIVAAVYASIEAAELTAGEVAVVVESVASAAVAFIVNMITTATINVHSLSLLKTNFDTVMNMGGNPVPRSKGDGIGEKLDLAPNAHNWSLQPNSTVTTKAKSCSSLSQLEQVAANQCYNYAQVNSCYFSSEMTASMKTKFDFIEMLEFFVMLVKLKEIWIEPDDAELIRYDYGYNYCEL
ncbi:MAG: hypothetical protein EZS28_027439 [Streblomastix strix]|uniref:Uncharacterized protein n=1 Tax=Streblomastix strix TaxID=222440 RepID=A0A5J4V4M8_9EUKA|nr:MAG: hypothetical protein EZS28_027439 [Streblomastix strix]